VLRCGEPPVVARIAEDRLIFDLRTVFVEQDAPLEQRLRELVSRHQQPS
jgi:seryl-tRNA(Sec) selenium transferase